MEIILPVPEAGQWEFERLRIFNTCFHCGAKREKESLGTLISGKKKRKCYTASCNCEEIVQLYEAIEEQAILEMINYYNISESTI